jgi:hypothetical protein
MWDWLAERREYSNRRYLKIPRLKLEEMSVTLRCWNWRRFSGSRERQIR